MEMREIELVTVTKINWKETFRCIEMGETVSIPIQACNANAIRVAAHEMNKYEEGFYGIKIIGNSAIVSHLEEDPKKNKRKKRTTQQPNA